jgi:hypothetical protein
MNFRNCVSVQPRPHRIPNGGCNCQCLLTPSSHYSSYSTSVLTRIPTVEDDAFRDRDIPYSLATVHALRSHSHVPYNFVPSRAVTPCMAMHFNSVLSDSDWTNTSLELLYIQQKFQQQFSNLGSCVVASLHLLTRSQGCS